MYSLHVLPPFVSQPHAASQEGMAVLLESFQEKNSSRISIKLELFFMWTVVTARLDFINGKEVNYGNLTKLRYNCPDQIF
jgi:hypothetical protein